MPTRSDTLYLLPSIPCVLYLLLPLPLTPFLGDYAEVVKYGDDFYGLSLTAVQDAHAVRGASACLVDVSDPQTIGNLRVRAKVWILASWPLGLAVRLRALRHWYRLAVARRWLTCALIVAGQGHSPDCHLRGPGGCGSCPRAAANPAFRALAGQPTAVNPGMWR